MTEAAITKKRLSIKDLIPATDYAVQIRAYNDEETSEWSRKFAFTTTSDDVKPKVPANVTWIADDDQFIGEWDSVTKNVDETNARIIRYEIEVSITTPAKLHVGAFNHITGVRQQFILTAADVKRWAGVNVDTVKFRVRAVNFGENFSDWSPLLTATLGAPDPPTNAVVTAMSLRVQVSWTPPVVLTNVAGYKVYVGSTAGFTANSTSLYYTGPNTVFTYNTATVQTVYFKIRSYSLSGRESADLTASGTSLPAGDDVPPNDPTSVAGTLTNSPDGKTATANITWSLTSPPADLGGFWIKFRPVGEVPYNMVTVDDVAREVTIDNLKPSVDYEVIVRSHDKSGNPSGWSATVVLTADANDPPAAPTGLTAVAGETTVHLEWNANTETDVADNNGYYEFQIDTVNTFPAPISYTSGDPNFDAVGLATTTTYYARVRAVDSQGLAGAWSGTVSFTTGDYPLTPLSDGLAPSTSPTPVVTGGIGYLHVGWPLVTNADLVTYEVHISTTTGFTAGPTTKVAQINGNAIVLEKDAAGAALVYGTTYYVKIIAKDVDGAAAAGTQASGTPVLAQSYDIQSISVAQLTTGTVNAAVITIDASGILKTANNNVQITGTGIIVTGTTSSIVADSIVTGNITATAALNILGTMTVSSSGWIQSSDFPGGTSGYRLTNTSLILRNGQVSANTFTAGTIGTQGAAAIIIAAGSYMDVQNGYIKGGGYNGTSNGLGQLNLNGSAGWYIGSNGLRIANGDVSASAISAGTIGGASTTDITVGANGTIHNTTNSFILNSSGIIATAGSIGGVSIGSGLIEANYVSNTSGFRLTSAGDAFFNDVIIRGVIYAEAGGTIGGSTIGSTYVESNNFTSSADGWKLQSDGTFTVKGTASTITGPTYQTAASGSARLVIDAPSSGRIRYLDSSNVTLATLAMSGGTLTLSSAIFTANDGIISNTIKVQTLNSYTSYGITVNSTDNAFVVNSTGSGATLNTGAAGTSIAGSGGLTVQGAGAVTMDTYNGGGSTTATITNAGKIIRTTSSKKYKTNIKNAKFDHDAILKLKPKTFIRRDEKHLDNPYVYAGFIAEEADELGLSHWVWKDRDGNVEGFHYDTWTVALHSIVQEQAKKIADLTSRLEKLERS